MPVDYNVIHWGSLVKYCPETPSGLKWKISHKNGMPSGRMAGSISNPHRSGQWSLKHLGRLYLVHRIIYILHNGKIDPSLMIDHIDGNPLNNRIDNLRLVTASVNAQNQRLKKSNVSGVPGVYPSGAKGYITWHVSINVKGHKQIKKQFSSKIYGEESAKILAIDYAIHARRQLNARGIANFSERHILGNTLNSSQEQNQKAATLDALFEN